jgi:Arc/MetJ-type ribon-helix-helix transcriptional regulator
MSQVEKITLTLPRELLQAVRQLVPEESQSEFIAQAIERFIKEHHREALQGELIAGYHAEGLAVTQEWEPLDEEAWSRHVPSYEGKEPNYDAEDSASLKAALNETERDYEDFLAEMRDIYDD